MADKLSVASTVRLASSYQIPVLGFGVWDSPAERTTQSCITALETGYRHIDTAQLYGNEAEVGQAVKKLSASIPREAVFITSKVLNPDPSLSLDKTYENCLASVHAIGGPTGYLDLLLIHNVTAGKDGVRLLWLAFERLLAEGKCRSIGVSNFGIGMIEGMRSYATTWPPHVNQLELHPWNQQREITSYCREQGIVLEAYCPLVRNQKENDETLQRIAAQHSKTTAQVLLRYSLQKGWLPLPKSDHPDRIRENASLFDFELAASEMAELDTKDQDGAGALVVAVDNAKTT